MQGIGFTDEINTAELHSLADAPTRELSRIDPPTVSFRYLTVHPEAIYLKAHPAEALYPLRARMYRAVASVLGANNSTESMPSARQFVPHVSIAYVSADGEMQLIAEALKTAVKAPVTATFRKASLLEFHRDHGMTLLLGNEPSSSDPSCLDTSLVLQS
jgi:2'-5' RNA ligase